MKKQATVALSLVLSALLSASPAGAQPPGDDFGSPRDVRSDIGPGPHLPTNSRHQRFLRLAITVNELLRSGLPSSRITISEHKGGDGESCYAFLNLDGKRVGMLMPPGNAAGNIETEANMWALFRIFGHEDLGQPCGYVTVGDWGQREFLANVQIYQTGPRGANRRHVEELMNKNGGKPMRFLFKYFDKPKSSNYTVALSGTRLDPYYHLTEVLGRDHAPPAHRAFELEKGKVNDEFFLARQFSTALLCDRLQGEYDRWGGTNLDLHSWKGRPCFAFYDNGGASWDNKDGGGGFDKYVFRFEPLVVERVRGMDDFLTGRSNRFLGFTRPEDLRIALELFTHQGWTGFRNNLHDVRAEIDHRMKGPSPLLR